MPAVASEKIGAGAGLPGPTGPGTAVERALPTVVIEPTGGWRTLDLREMWSYRELLYFLALRDVKVRYKQTALGVLWVLVQPLVAMAIFTVIFGRLAGLPSDGLPYPLFAYAGLLPWTYFANAVNSGGTSLVANTNLVSKVYFPRLLLPLASVLSGLLDLAVGAGLLVLLTLAFGIVPGPSLLALAPLVLLLAAAAFAVGVWLAAIDVRYRDVRYAVPFLIQIWLFATPIAYSTSLVPAEYRTWYALNPMVGVVEGFRWAVLGRGDFPAAMLAVSTAVVALLLVGGLLYFRRVERGFADVI